MTVVYDAFGYPIQAGDLLRFPGHVDQYRSAARVMKLLDEVDWDQPDETPKPVIRGRWCGDEVSVRVDGDNSTITSDGDVMAFERYLLDKLNERSE